MVRSFVTLLVISQKVKVRGVYPYLPMVTNAPWSFYLGGGSIKSLILSFNSIDEKKHVLCFFYESLKTCFFMFFFIF